MPTPIPVSPASALRHPRCWGDAMIVVLMLLPTMPLCLFPVSPPSILRAFLAWHGYGCHPCAFLAHYRIWANAHARHLPRRWRRTIEVTHGHYRHVYWYFTQRRGTVGINVASGRLGCAKNKHRLDRQYAWGIVALGLPSSVQVRNSAHRHRISWARQHCHLRTKVITSELAMPSAQ